jgi:ADP-L-glycero-D-manno-heptose 6-epimerase
MIAITGAAGFIGSNLALRLAGRGHDLLLVDHPLTTGKAANFVGLSRFGFIDHEAFLAHLCADRPRLTGLFHLGACSRTTETDRNYLQRNNVEYSQAVWEWCAANGCPLVYASSAATYGNGSLGFDDRIPPENLRPLNLYGESKSNFDVWALAQCRDGQPTPPGWAGMKFFNVYGPREIHKGGMASVVLHAYRQIIETGEVRLFRSNDSSVADGEQRRDFVYVRDCIDHMLWLWTHPDASGIYNSGTGTARTFLDLAKAVFLALGREPAIRFIDMPPNLVGQYQSFTQADMTKLRQTGYECAPTTLEYGVLATVEWLLDRDRTGSSIVV